MLAGNESLLDALCAHRGLVCFVGAGGKKTTMYRLAAMHPGRVGITATVHIPTFPENMDAVRVIASERALTGAVIDAASKDKKIAFGHPSEKRGRFAGLSPSVLAQIRTKAGFDVIMVKADGARMRWLKAPNDIEPQIPDGTDTVIAVVSARAFGEPLSERIAHRVELVEKICGMRRGERMEPRHIARLLADADGICRGSGAARVIPLINMVDDETRQTLATETAMIALQATDRFDRVVLASMHRDDALVDLIER